MSYCRFSSDAWRSDVYVYESDRGFECHVAKVRLVDWENSPMAKRPAGLDLTDPRWLAHHQEESRWLDAAVRAPIGLAFDGESRTFGDATEAAVFLEELAAAGYHVPRYAVDALLEEIDDDDAAVNPVVIDATTNANGPGRGPIKAGR